MKKYTKEDGINVLRAEKGQANTIGGTFYSLLQSMDPAIIEKMEQHFGEVIAAGYNIGSAINEAEKDPVKKQQMANAIIKAAMGNSESFTEEE